MEIKTISQDGKYYNSEKSHVSPLIPESINSMGILYIGHMFEAYISVGIPWSGI